MWFPRVELYLQRRANWEEIQTSLEKMWYDSPDSRDTSWFDQTEKGLEFPSKQKHPPPEVQMGEQVISNWGCEHILGIQLLVEAEGLQSVWGTMGALMTRRLQKGLHQAKPAKSQE